MNFNVCMSLILYILYFLCCFLQLCNILNYLMGYEYLCILTFAFYIFLKYLDSYNLFAGLLFFGLYINKIKYIKRTMNTNLKIIFFF